MNPRVLSTKKFYEKHGRKSWTERKTNSFYYEKEFTKLASLWPAKSKILDIGCAAGIHVPLFLGIGRHVKYEGTDISKQFLKDAQRRYPQLPFFEEDIATGGNIKSNQYGGFWAANVLMHIPFELWDAMFANLERIVKAGRYGFLTLPTAHPNPEDTTDTRHFTFLPADKQKKYLKERGWKIIKSGSTDGFTQKDIWRWYIVQLPK
ncbi:MAG: class I SAM-dependent methyltransferase [Candidatus Paceibacteria bacterium]